MTLIQFPLDKFVNAYQFDNPEANAELIRYTSNCGQGLYD
jgi:hypothetical protein